MKNLCGQKISIHSNRCRVMTMLNSMTRAKSMMLRLSVLRPPSKTIENEPITSQSSFENQHVHDEDPYVFQDIAPTPPIKKRPRKQQLVARKEPHKPIILLERYVGEDDVQEEDNTQNKTKRNRAKLDCDESAPTQVAKKKKRSARK